MYSNALLKMEPINLFIYYRYLLLKTYKYSIKNQPKILITRKILNFIFYYQAIMKKTKVEGPKIDGYSRNCKYTETFFHHPSRNQHYQSEYQKKMANKQFNTFRLKKTPQYKDHLYTSSLNQFPSRNLKVEKLPYEGQKKILVEDQSFKRTDPVSLRFERGPDKPKFKAPFEGSILYKAQIERTFYLPSQRQLSKSRKLYHSQLGISLEYSRPITPRSIINSSVDMKHTIQYNQHPLNRTLGSLDSFRYNSRK